MSRTASDADRIKLEADECGMADITFVEHHWLSQARRIPISPSPIYSDKSRILKLDAGKNTERELR